MAYTPENNPYIPGDPYSYDLKWQVQHIKYLLGRVNDLDAAVQEATDQAIISEGHATGTANGEPVGPDSPYFENNSKFYSEVSDAESLVSEGYAKGTQDGEAVSPGSPYYENNAKFYAEKAQLDGHTEVLKAEGFANGEAEGVPITDPSSPYYENNSKYYAQEAASSEQAAADYVASLGDHVAGAVADWLNDNVDPDSGYVIDKSLTVADAAADALVTGDNLTLLKHNKGIRSRLSWGAVVSSRTPDFTDQTSFMYAVYPISELQQRTWLINKKTTLRPLYNISMFKSGVLVTATGWVEYTTQALITYAQNYLTIDPDIDEIGVTIIYTTDGTTSTRQTSGFTLDDALIYRRAIIDDDISSDTNLTWSSSKITSEFAKYIKHTTGYVIVAPSDGDFTTIQDAIDNTSDGDTIFVMPGTYREHIDMNDKKRYLIGLDKRSCVITNGTADYLTPPIEANVGLIKNFNIIADTYGRPTYSPTEQYPHAYAIHVDNAYGSSHTLTIENCNITSLCAPAIGLGVRYNQTVILDHCRLTCTVATNWSAGLQAIVPCGAMIIHNDSQGSGISGTLQMMNCTVKGVSLAVKMNSMDNGNLLTCFFVDNTFWSDNTGVGAGTFVRENGSTDPGMLCGQDIALAIMSHSNNLADFNA